MTSKKNKTKALKDDFFRSLCLEITITCRFVAYLLYTYACIKHMRILNILQLNAWFINLFIGDARDNPLYTV